MGTHLGHADNLAIRTPAAILEKLGYLGSLTRARLAHDNRDRVCFYEIQEALAMLGNR